MADMAGQDRKKGNLKMALVLASIAAAFFIGFVAKMIFLGR